MTETVDNVNMVDVVYDQIKDQVKNADTINSSNIIILVTLLIKCVEKIAKDKEGSYKKNLVLQVLTKVINESNLDVDSKLSLQLLVHTTIPIIIDTMIGISKEQLDLGKSGVPRTKRCIMC